MKKLMITLAALLLVALVAAPAGAEQEDAGVSEQGASCASTRAPATTLDEGAAEGSLWAQGTDPDCEDPASCGSGEEEPTCNGCWVDVCNQPGGNVRSCYPANHCYWNWHGTLFNCAWTEKCCVMPN